MRRAWVLGTCALFVCGLAGASESWVEVKSPNFTVASNAGERTARQTAWEFEQVRAAYARLWPWAKPAAGRPVVVLALKNEPTLRDWAPEYFEVKGGIQVVSVSTHGADADYLLLRTDSQPNHAAVAPNYNLYRAYLTALLSAGLERRLPLWLSNGLSEVFGNVSVRDKEVQVGRPVPWYLEHFNQRPRLPMRTVLEAEPGSALVLKDADREAFDAQCWVLVHYLTFADDGAYAVELNRFIRNWLAGQSQGQALAASLGDMGAIEKQLPTYASRAILPFGQLLADVNIDSAKPPVRPVPQAELASLQASVHVAMGRPREAEAAIQRARAGDPKSPASYDAEGLLADRQAENERAARAFSQATEAGSTRAHSYYRAAQLAWKPDADAATLAAIRKRLERALELNPAHAGAHAFLAETLVQQSEAQAALPLAQRAVVLEPGKSSRHLVLARVLHELGRREDAQASAQRGLQLAASAGERSDAQHVLGFMAQTAAYEQRRAADQAQQELATACSGGDTASCAQLLPGLESACAEGHPEACTFAAWIYRAGRGLAQDASRAAGLIERACALGNKRSCVDHAWARAQGEGLPRDEAQAQVELEALCQGEFFAACTRLAVLHVARPAAGERARAKELLRKACTGGEADACRLAETLK